MVEICNLTFYPGTLEQYEQAVSKCEAQMNRINERREKVGILFVFRDLRTYEA